MISLPPSARRFVGAIPNFRASPSFPRRLTATIAALLSVLLMVTPATAQLAPPDAKQWDVNNTSDVQTGTDYELYDRGRQIGYMRQDQGLNLGWAGHSGGHFVFLMDDPRPANVPPHRDHRHHLIPSPQTHVALYNTKARAYLKYQRRTDGKPELTWSNSVSYEWQLHDLTPANGRVRFALFNERKGKYLVEQLKTGMDLGWYGETPAPLSFSVALSAQPVIQGWVPYLGKFPIIGTANGNLLSVTNAGGPSVTLFFVKPGFSTTQCGNANATVVVGPGAKMTPAQMQTLYGSATPGFPINFLACVAAAPGQNVLPLTHINITYRVN